MLSALPPLSSQLQRGSSGQTRSAAAMELRIVPSMSNSSAPKVRFERVLSLMAVGAAEAASK
jgi:hypothetical protein